MIYVCVRARGYMRIMSSYSLYIFYNKENKKTSYAHIHIYTYIYVYMRSD